MDESGATQENGSGAVDVPSSFMDYDEQPPRPSTDQSAIGERLMEPPATPGSSLSPSTPRPTPRPTPEESEDCCVQVAVRIRPLLSHEGSNEDNCLSVRANMVQIGGSQGPRFTFDHVFTAKDSQAMLFDTRIKPLVHQCLEGYNATVCAYGQTGSGKTHTIMGPTTTHDDPQAGVIPRALTFLFQRLADTSNDSTQTTVSVQFLELYGEEIRDLLSRTGTKDKLTIRDYGNDEPEVVGATQTSCLTAEEAMEYLQTGMLRRVTGATAMNESSSRSHAIFSVSIEQSTLLPSNEHNNSSEVDGGGIQTKRSKFCFVDLAGAERQKRTQATGKRLQEGIDINKGLSNLGNVISALGDPRKRGKTHVPYRDAKLTRLLKGSLGGNHKTLMIACVSPAASNMGESLNCLRYANRAKNIQNKAVVNVDGATKRIQELREQVRVLAVDLLLAMDGKFETLQHTKEQLVAVLGGKVVSGISSLERTPSKQLKQTQRDLNEATQLLRQVQTYHDAAEEELVVTKAENARYDALIGALAENKDLTHADVDKAFTEKAKSYEEEIMGLQRKLADAHRRMSILSNGFFDDENEGDETQIDLEHEELLLAEQRVMVAALSPTVLPETFDEPVVNPASKSLCSIHASASLDELSSSIEAKERLIEQIKKSKERESMMRSFYEKKLNDLQSALVERESERDRLLEELAIAKDQNGSSEELQQRLDQKEQQIEALKNMQRNYRRQTAVASKSAADLTKLIQLQNEVKNMKKRKADMQKELAQEKRVHARDVIRLSNVVTQKDREISKIKRESTQHEVEASKAKAVSKNRYDELTQLRKTLKQYKKKIGLDPVLLGRRHLATSHPSNREVDFNTLREYFDMKVAGVVRKEALVDKLATEWEEYFELQTQLDATDPATDQDGFRTLRMKMDFVNDKIRKTAKRLRKDSENIQEAKTKQPATQKSDALLFGKEFAQLCSGYNIERAKSVAAPALFGMVVRERRRVALLAKTASSLDERLVQAEKQRDQIEASLRALKDETNREIADLDQKHQEHILSLMHMVASNAEDASSGEITRDDVGSESEYRFQKQLLVLASERVGALESQVTDLRSESTVREEYLERLDDMKSLLDQKTKECESYEQVRNNLRSVIRQIRQQATDFIKEEPRLSCFATSIIRVIDGVLHSEEFPHRKSSDHRGLLGNDRLVTPKLMRHIELMHSSDSDSADEVEQEEPEWAAKIMADLDLIVKGEIPSLVASPPDVLDDIPVQGSSVFDRLANPKSFTGTQKGKAKRSKPKEGSSRNRSACVRETPRHEEATNTALPAPSDESDEHEATKPDDHETSRQSVFDRLCSPSQFTGTQRGKFKDSRAKRDRAAEVAAERVLEGLLVDQDYEHYSEQSIGKSLSGLEEYSKSNVFDRLQKRTTHAAAVRQNETLHHDVAHQSHPPRRDRWLINEDSDFEKQVDSPEFATEQVSNASSKPDVFARLQRATTPASSGRPGEHDEPKRSSQPSTTGERLPNRDYTKQNVFERLTKTTTEAFEQKLNRPGSL